MPSTPSLQRTGAEGRVSEFVEATGRHSASTTRLRRIVMRAGTARFAAVVTVVSAVLSITATATLEWLFDFPPSVFWRGIVIGLAVPLVITPMLAVFFANLMMEVDDARRTAEWLATIDPLTGVCNRRRFFVVAQSEFDRARRLAQPLAVMLIDVDHFKAVNDVHGHAIGDTVLRDVAQACALELRQYDVLARYGGEEFVALLPATEMPMALTVAERLRACVAALRCESPGRAPVQPTVSIGVTSRTEATASLAELIDRADQAMYAAKQGGRNLVCAAPSAITESAAGTPRA